MPQNPVIRMQTQTSVLRNVFSGAGQPLPPPTPQIAPPQPDPQPAFGSLEALRLAATLWRGRLWIGLAALLFAGLGVAYLRLVAVPTYTAFAAVALETRQEQFVDLENVMSGLTGDQTTINTEVEVLRSRNLIAALVDTLDLTTDPEFNATLRPQPAFAPGALLAWLTAGDRAPPSAAAIREATVDAVARAVAVSNLRQTYVFRIAATTESPAKSALLANTLSELYISNQLAVKFDATAQATGWLSERVAELQIELEAAEAKVKDFDAATDLVSPEALGFQRNQVKDLRARSEAATLAAENSGAALAALLDAMPEDLSGLAAAGAAAGAETDARALTAAIAAGRFEARRDELVAAREVTLARNRSQAAALARSVAELSARTESQAADLVTLRQLQREAEASRLIYEYFLGRLKETSVQQGIQQADSRVLSQAVDPVRPSAPNSRSTLILFIGLGAALASGLVLLREARASTFRTAEDLELLTGHRVLGQTPRLPVSRRAGVLDHLVNKPASAGAEAIRNLRTSLMLANIDHPPQVIVMTSSVAGEGKTTQSVALALNYAGLGRKVLLIEGDLRRRVFSDYTTLATKGGLAAIIAQSRPEEEVIQTDPRLGIDILQAEPTRVNAADLYASAAFASFLRRMRESYDIIVIDTPPVLPVSDARVIGQHADAILYTVLWDKTPRAQVAQGLKSFADAGLRVTGLVLSQIDPRRMKRYGLDQYSETKYYQE